MSHRYNLRYILVGDRSKQLLVWSQVGYIDFVRSGVARCYSSLPLTLLRVSGFFLVARWEDQS